MSNKSIAILGSRGIPARYGGFETFAEELAIRLAASGVSVTVYCERNDKDDRLATFRGVTLEFVPCVGLGPLTTILFDLRCLWRARKRFDVVYMLGYGAAFSCFLPRLWGAGVWINMDGIEWKRSKWNSLARAWFRIMEKTATWTATRLIADAAAIREHLLRRHDTTTPITVIPYGARVVQAPGDEALHDFGVSSGGYYLVVCRLEPENHVHEILLGFTASGTRRSLVVVGDIEAGTAYTEQLKRVRDDRIRFVGTVFDPHKLDALRWHCHAYFHGHSVGGTNPSLLEALGCGNRIMAHDNPFNREVAGRTAEFFYNLSDVTRIIERMDVRVDADSVRKAAQRRVSERYSWSAVAATYLDLLSDEVQDTT